MNGLFKETTLGISPPSHNLMDIPDEVCHYRSPYHYLKVIVLYYVINPRKLLMLNFDFGVFNNLKNLNPTYKKLLLEHSMYPIYSVFKMTQNLILHVLFQ